MSWLSDFSSYSFICDPPLLACLTARPSIHSCHSLKKKRPNLFLTRYPAALRPSWPPTICLLIHCLAFQNWSRLISAVYPLLTFPISPPNQCGSFSLTISRPLHFKSAPPCHSLTPSRLWRWSPGICYWPTGPRTSPWSCCFHSSETPSAGDRWSLSGNSGPARPCPCRNGCRFSDPPGRKWEILDIWFQCRALPFSLFWFNDYKDDL